LQIFGPHNFSKVILWEDDVKYTFEILGVAPILSFFNQQQELLEHQPNAGVEYLGNRKCTLDAFVQSVETVSPNRGWEVDRVVDTVIGYWMNNSDSIQYWKRRLQDTDSENLLVARVGDIKSLQAVFESLLAQ
jgi:plasmid maintenance system antidote protein VapI